MWLSLQMAAVVANTVIGNSTFAKLQCYLLASPRDVTSFFLDCRVKNLAHFPNLGYTLNGPFQGSLKQQSDAELWNVDSQDATVMFKDVTRETKAASMGGIGDE